MPAPFLDLIIQVVRALLPNSFEHNVLQETIFQVACQRTCLQLTSERNKP